MGRNEMELIESRSASESSEDLLANDIHQTYQALDLIAQSLQPILDRGQDLPSGSIQAVLSTLKQAQETILALQSHRQPNEMNLEEAQKSTRTYDELQTLLDVLPVGIAVSHDLKNQTMTMNPAGLKMLGLTPEMNPSMSAPTSVQLPFKVMRNGHEVPVDELPMEYAVTHKVIVEDLEVDIHRADGKIINLLEYAAPLYNKQGNVSGSLCVLIDITSRKTIEKRLVMQYTIARVLAESNTVNGAAKQVLQLICESTGWEYGALWRVDPDRATLTNEGVWLSAGIQMSEYADKTSYSVLKRDDTSLPGYVFRQGEPLWLSDINEFGSPDIFDAAKAGVLSACVLPVRSGNRIIAILECLSIRIQIQDENLTAMLNAVCNQIGIFLERKLLEDALASQAVQQQLLVQTGLALSSSMDYEDRLKAIIHMIVPYLADWCAIDIVDYDNILRRVAAAHINPDKENLVYKNQPTPTIDPTEQSNPQSEMLRTGKSIFYPEISADLIDQFYLDPVQKDIIRQLRPVSSISVPLVAHNRILGLCTFVQSDSGRHYDASDLELAERIAGQAALSLDNAMLYAETRKLNSDLELRVEERTSQLKSAITQLQNQIAERQNAENQVRILNTELENRIAERTSQLEQVNLDLQKEIIDRQQASQMLQDLLARTSELYRISQTIGTVRTPQEVLKVLLSSRYLKNVSRASIAILDRTWIENAPPPNGCFILAEWNRGRRQPGFTNQHFSLEEYGLALAVPFRKPVIIPDIQAVMELPEPVRKRFSSLQTHSLIILPLIASGEWYGLLSLHFKTRRMTKMDDLLHMRGLVDETAIVIKNMRLLEAESQARQEAERANALKLKFLGMVSHELRTPLTSIKGFATTLMADDVIWPPDKQRSFLETINKESDTLHDLIEQLLDLSRLEAGILRIHQEHISMNKVLESALPQLHALTTEHNLVVKVPGGLPLIFGDDLRISQVLTNLVSNAAKYSPPGSQITISMHQTGGMIQTDVADQGPGIPPHDRERVFEAFQQLENGAGNNTKGAGLGLAICKGLIESQNGKIWIQDHLSPGATISFTLPLTTTTMDKRMISIMQEQS